jgi:MFS family permease
MEHKNELITIYLIMFTEILGWSLILPFLPFLAKDLGATAFTVGLIISSFSIFQFFSAPIIGKLSDKFGRKPLLIISQISTLVGFLTLGFANTLFLVFLSRAIDGLFGSNMTLSRAYITDITTKENRTKIFGFTGVVFSLGMFLGPALGGYLSTINYSIPAFLAAGISLISIILTFIFLKETVKTKKEVKLKLNDFFPLKDFIKGIRNKELKSVFFEYFFYITGFTIITASLALFTDAQLGFVPSDIGTMMMILASSRIIFQALIFPKLLKKVNEDKLTIFGIILIFLAMISMYFVNSKIIMYVLMALFAIGAGITRPVIISDISRKAKEGEKGKFMGVLDSIGSISQIIAPLIGGFIINNYYPGTIGLLAASFMLIALTFEIIGMKNKKINPLN